MELLESFTEFDSYKEWLNKFTGSREEIQSKILANWVENGSSETHLWGWCDVCSTDTHFLLDRRYSNESLNPWQPNWRERLTCTACKLNARMRAAFYIQSKIFDHSSDIWVAEQLSQYFKVSASKYPKLVGSEYLGANYQSGFVMNNGIRNEDCTQTSFSSNSLDGVLSFDVMEHIPDYLLAISEAFRILRKNGVFLWSAPFDSKALKTVVRAQVLDDGSVKHHLDPIYHGDPLNSSQGILCYQIFGWDIISLLNEIGFKEVKILFMWSKQRVILGNPLPFFIATK